MKWPRAGDSKTAIVPSRSLARSRLRLSVSNAIAALNDTIDSTSSGRASLMVRCSRKDIESKERFPEPSATHVVAYRDQRRIPFSWLLLVEGLSDESAPGGRRPSNQ